MHDAALIVLESSALDSCEHVVPISPNREPLTEAVLGDTVLQGGFGSLSESYDFSPIKYWSLLEFTYFSSSGDNVLLKEIGEGGPTFGDSGSGALYRFPDGQLRVVGIDSTKLTFHGFGLVDNQLELIDAHASASDLCGSIDAGGACRGTAIVSCDDSGFVVTDCPLGQTCELDSNDTPSCVECSCGQEPTCDPDCPCECDESDSCDEGCDCDPACIDLGDASANAELDAGVDAQEPSEPLSPDAAKAPPDSSEGCAMSRSTPSFPWFALLALGWWAIRRRR